MPRWNCAAAQLGGVIDKIESVEETPSVVRSTAQVLKAEFGHDWAMSGSIDDFRQIMPAVGAFRFTVTRAEAIFKLWPGADRPDERPGVPPLRP